MSLKRSFQDEARFPIVKRGPSSIEDEIIPLFPYLPGCDYEDFHEEGGVVRVLCVFKSGKKICLEIPAYV